MGIIRDFLGKFVNETISVYTRFDDVHEIMTVHDIKIPVWLRPFYKSNAQEEFENFDLMNDAVIAEIKMYGDTL